MTQIVLSQANNSTAFPIRSIATYCRTPLRVSSGRMPSTLVPKPNDGWTNRTTDPSRKLTYRNPIREWAKSMAQYDSEA